MSASIDYRKKEDLGCFWNKIYNVLKVRKRFASPSSLFFCFHDSATGSKKQKDESVTEKDARKVCACQRANMFRCSCFRPPNLELILKIIESIKLKTQTGFCKSSHVACLFFLIINCYHY